MNVRAACDITFPPPPPPSSIRYTYKGSAWQPGRSSPERKGWWWWWWWPCASRAHIVLNLLRPELDPSLSLCVHPSRNSSWLQIKPSVKYYRRHHPLEHPGSSVEGDCSTVDEARFLTPLQNTPIPVHSFFFFPLSQRGQTNLPESLHLFRHFSRKFFTKADISCALY